MNKLWTVAWQEYQRNVFKKSFILLLFSVPVFITISIGFGLFLEAARDNPLPVGYVDQAGMLQLDVVAPELQATWIDEQDDPVELLPFTDRAQAQTALEAGQIQAFYVLPSDYVETRRIEQVFVKKPGENAWYQFYNFLQINLAASQAPEIARRLAAGSDVIIRSIDGSRVVTTGGPTFGLLMPLFITMAFLFMLLMSSGYTMSAIADEKENRTIEVMVTTISPTQLIGGKILGIVAISLTLLLTWAAEISLGIGVARQLGVAWFNDLSLDWYTILVTIAIAIPAYVLATALMAAIGAMVTTTQEGQSISAIFVILHLIPMYISWGFVENPHSSFAVILGILPFTALMATGMRNLFTIVPTWQILVSVVVQVLSAVGAIWLAGRALRLGMLRYGQRLTWRRLFKSQTERRAARHA
jgi:ABC-2 type transport system permease protein